MSAADELRAAAEALTGDVPVYAPGTARIVGNPAENELIISVCDQHDESAPATRFDAFGHCRNCVFVRLHAGESRFARQLAALINARKPLAAWLEEIADEADRHAAQGMGNSVDEVACGHPLTLARQINAST
ncbi:hypothetical protein ACFQVD_26830 [Streptosporangium amethystogenes subsp. fukuiense]|uniref:Uncharacterized protein n=1 Tax=Streptosporangium amethystogenes subsp. fukuiense TaxID=698418 RepID=A0ABW2T5T3_9ACTN